MNLTKKDILHLAITTILLGWSCFMLGQQSQHKVTREYMKLYQNQVTTTLQCIEVLHEN